MPPLHETASLPVHEASKGKPCWCGEPRAESFGEDYLACSGCGTLRRRQLPTAEELGLGQEDGFYGRDYWFEHQTQRGQPDLVERSRRDLVDRVPRWLRAVLRYASPPGRCLEVGCGHGGLAFLLGESGFEVQGHDLSRAAAQFAGESFGVEVQSGTLEAPAAGETFDVVVAIDVLEHALDPRELLTRVAERVAEDGLLVLQTPRRPDDPLGDDSARGLSYEALETAEDPFLSMLIDEHVFLFPRPALEQLLEQLGFVELAWPEAPFPYDMLAVASRRPLRLRSNAEVRDLLLGSPSQREVLALLDLDAALAARTETLRQAEMREHEATTRLVQVRRLARDLRQREMRAAERANIAEQAGAQARAQVAQLTELLDRLRHSGFFQLLVKSGRWRETDEAIRTLLEPPVEPPPTPSLEATVSVEASVAPRRRGAIAIDLTPMLPGATNGGAKVTSLLLVRDLIRLCPDDEFVLLTAPLCHDELAELDGPRVRRRLLPSEPTALMELHEREPVSVLVCPMGGARSVDPRVPVLTVVHDLQHAAYPEFFADQDRQARQLNLEHAARWSERIITVSEFVRQTVLDHLELPREQVVSIPHGVRDRLPRLDDREVERICGHHGLRRGQYLLYPANCWPHKNHALLLTAFARLCQRRPEAGLHLVLTGADQPDPAGVLDQVERMGLAEDVLWLGFVPTRAFAGLLQGCRALIFPSLYEGFGMPVVEAMAAGRPVLCSDSATFQEVAGSAALTFDPRRPHDLCAAIERLLDDAQLESELVAAGRQRLSRMDDTEACSRRYVEQVRLLSDSPRPMRDGVAGVWEDGWTQHRLLVSSPDGRERRVELTFANSRDDAVEVTVEQHCFTVPPRHLFYLGCRLPSGPRLLEIGIAPTFSPQQRGENEDYRHLGLVLLDHRVVVEVEPTGG
ncbi:MAG: glycosyltransferase [Acidobacteriota bacterium]